MKIEATELKPGQVIRVEYGCPDNWVDFTVDRIHHFENMVTVKCHHGSIVENIGCAIHELVEVVTEGVEKTE